ncbi:MAG: ABC transporter ATP-binding protein [Ardenticatenaceae bacterium]|nr:ABC transporter ATP-binding protein [Ardenticatenaceae bacterium]MCB8950107.1 ABC transporter ATP-binding protein [Ardenticatenaceae bacterium]
MSNFAISVENIGKKYHIGGVQTKYHTIRDTLATAFMSPLRRARSLLQGHSSGAADLYEEIWALKDISFEVDHGEVVGLIGRNGAGKSTLLKVLSRITEPTEGIARIHGRVGSLLEVGTGFHPELSGRENVYLNGAILGMKRFEIDRQFDEIVDFAEVEKFIDTPVKHYSSGMRVRLAFAVAAHLDPEILLVDEVLSVGDARFQRKCLNKMQDVSHGGRTVIFVSHNMSSVTRLCERALLLENGRITDDGLSHKVVASYMQTGLGTVGAREWADPNLAPGGEIARLRGVYIRAASGEATDTVDIRKPFTVEMAFDVLKPGYKLLPHFHFVNEEGIKLFVANDLDPEWRGQERPSGRYISKACVPGNFLAEGTVFVQASLITLEPIIRQFYESDAVAFQVVDNMDGDSARGDFAGTMPGLVRPSLEWETQYYPNGK